MSDKKSILIVDDTEINIDILVDLLGDVYEVLVALDGESALEILEDELIDLILLDIIMPIMDGFEVCEILKNNPKTSNIPVLFITAKTDETSIERAYSVGGADYVTKPFKSIELLAKIDNQLKLKSLIDSLEQKVEEQVKEIVQTQELMLQNSRMAQMGEMISMIAHQWRQPLGAISAVTVGVLTKISLEKYDLAIKEDRDLCLENIINKMHKINDLVNNLSNTIDDFRNFFKPEKEVVFLSINSPLSKTFQVIAASLESDKISLTKNLKSEKIIDMYDNELMQVFLSILQNSQDNFNINSIEDPYIIINTKDTENGIEIEIIDNGGGIPTEIIDRIFDPYFSTKSEKNGTGLGLAMSRTIINKHHEGNISASNRDNGVSFKIMLKDNLKNS